MVACKLKLAKSRRYAWINVIAIVIVVICTSVLADIMITKRLSSKRIHLFCSRKSSDDKRI